MQKTVKLISLAPESHQGSVTLILQRLGFDFTIIDPVVWLQQKFQEHGTRIILLLPETDFPIEKIARAILSTPNSAYLLIYSSPLTAELNPILQACGDCCRWPCSPFELDFRLQRLPTGQSTALDLNSLDLEAAAWKNLNLIGQSTLFLNTLAFIKKASHCDAPVLIEGETGCGKEVAARAIHYLGNRKDYPFVPMNCGAIPDHLFENELFGHEKGAYTDAKQSQQGLTEQAHRGTLFLDEIEALPAKGQVTLLRFIEDKMIRPLGSKTSKKVDVKVIAASNLNLSELVAKGLFRQDLLFRLNLLHLQLPPLRERKSDIPYLAEHFIEKYRRQYQQPLKRLHPETLAWMIAHHWPGNVRELENFVHRSFLLSQDADIILSEASRPDKQAEERRKLFERRQHFDFDAPFNEAKNHAIDHFEQRYLTWLISSAKGNVTQAAGIAQKERRALGKLLKKHAINPILYRGI
ncbi:sigma-54 dependent transcriptional regulator [Methylomicrobium sp. Wu6]|uniref:sigma-54 dependent transcriptional regulator n=1 Tax=Methylomicrobium sp. Wu6 TaxID=3107928 RepID=UPI002DD62748|nr:sigma-54 dependent transcriptional regulator [Methylomicrobium sp. Wu6]MEC4748968.1 sigma-54 dependent transcriptional regulator [Methylomicrobium sp. Wu6]